MNDATLHLSNIRKNYPVASGQLEVLKGVSLSVLPGEIVGLLGPSGSGKSTLLHIAGLLDGPTDGTVTIDGTACADLGDTDRTRLRRQTVGFVYQFHNLLPEFSAVENVVMPQLIEGVGRGEARDRATALLERVGLGDRLGHKPTQLSGGEQQRVAIARALANRPKLLLADEPTGNLDETTSGLVFEELLRLTREDGVAALIATHNTDLAARMDRRILLHDGRLEA